MYISRDIVELVREKSNIVDIIHAYVPSLKKKGKNYIGLCPFHKENTPSFTVAPEKQIFHCFGCHTGGNVFTFISKIEKMEFPETVHFLAEKAGIAINESSQNKTDNLSDGIMINSYVLKILNDFIHTDSGKQGYEYLIKRGVTPESIDHFKLGYSPDSWDFLTNQLRRKGFDLERAVQCGVISSTIKNGNKRFFDRFRNRVLFPIFDANERPVAFGGRIIGSGEPKYLNSPETDLFKKRLVLYGFDRAKNIIRDLNRAIVVEGYLDVIGCHQKGIQNVVAPLGTALTEEQLLFLSRYATEVILIFDADSAGESASLRTLSKIGTININCRIGVLPEGDPFDFILKNGEREFMAIVDSSMKPVDYQLSRITDPKNIQKKGNLRVLLESFSIIKSILYETERNHYLKKLSSLLEIDENSVRKDFQSYVRGERKPGNGSTTSKSLEIQEDNFLVRSYKELIQLLFNYPELIQKAAIDFSSEQIPNEMLKKIFGTIIHLYSSNNIFSVDKMFDFFPSGLEMEFLNECLNSDYTFEYPDAVYTEIYLNMKIYEIDKKINSCVNLMEIEVLKREKEKLQLYILNKHMNHIQ